jgi:hypothetical protein
MIHRIRRLTKEILFWVMVDMGIISNNSSFFTNTNKQFIARNDKVIFFVLYTSLWSLLLLLLRISFRNKKRLIYRWCYCITITYLAFRRRRLYHSKMKSAINLKNENNDDFLSMYYSLFSIICFEFWEYSKYNNYYVWSQSLDHNSR